MNPLTSLRVGLPPLDLHLLGGAEELRGGDPTLVRRAHDVPPELLPARPDAEPADGEAAAAEGRRATGGWGGAGEGGETKLELPGSLKSRYHVKSTNKAILSS